jgi:rfaE bifunctional protein nucleotidyltransferase chain/domain
VSAWRAHAVAVTLGSNGALLTYGSGAPSVSPAPKVPALDTCGAGDRFAVTAVLELARDRLPTEAVAAAVAAASAYVAAGGPAALFGSPAGHSAVTDAASESAAPAEIADLLEGVRASGGTVVAAGGCFDLLHAGHIATLQSARSLGDCLVVCLNSDASVRRLKGPHRPFVSGTDRARVLAALGCVDAVVVFEEDTPEAVLGRLRPDIWVKGGDYAGMDVPETAVLDEWGGQVVTVPYLAGRSTSQLAHAAADSSIAPATHENKE